MPANEMPTPVIFSKFASATSASIYLGILSSFWFVEPVLEFLQAILAKVHRDVYVVFEECLRFPHHELKFLLVEGFGIGAAPIALYRFSHLHPPLHDAH